MKKKILFTVLTILYIIGVLIYAEPELRTVVNDSQNRKVIEHFAYDVDKKSTEKKNDDYAVIAKYNTQLYDSRQAGLTEPWAFEQNSIEMAFPDFEEDIVGVLTVPSMDIKLPIYAGATKENMAKGVALLGETSYPSSGENVNTVLAAHRGWKGIPMFRNIEQIEIGDTFTIETSCELLTYKVTGTRIISPDDIDAICIQPGRNLATLITCHPYTKNYQRYVVYGELIESNQQDIDGATDNSEAYNSEAYISDAYISETDNSMAESTQNNDIEILDRELTWHRYGYLGIVVIGIGIFISGIYIFKKKSH